MTLSLLFVGCRGTKPGVKEVFRLERESVIGGPVQNDQRGFSFIRAVGVDKAHNLYLVDKGRVLKLDKSGRTLWCLDKRGQGPGEFHRVVDVALGKDGDVYLADQEHQKVMIFSSSGSFRGEFKVKSGRPIKLDVDSRGFIYVSFLESNSNFLLHKYEKQGTLVGQMVRKGCGEEKNPMIRSHKNKVSFAVDNHDNIYVAYPYEYRLLKLDPRGKLLAQWTHPLPFSPKKVKIVQPQPNWLQIDGDLIIRDIALDRDGNIFVFWGCRATEKGYPIDVFDAQRQYRGHLFSNVCPEEDHPMQFYHIDDQNRLYVSRTGEEPTVHRFLIIGTI